MNKMTLNFLAISENESFSRSVVAGFCLGLNPTIEQIGDIKTAVSEAVTNCIVHAYHNSGRDYITIEAVIDEDTLYLRIIDNGSGIEDVSKAMQPFFTSGNTDERSGMGFTVMQALMDEITVNSKLGEGTEVLMKKIFDKSVGDDA